MPRPKEILAALPPVKRKAAKLMASRSFRAQPGIYRELVEEAISLLYVETPEQMKEVRDRIEKAVMEAA